MIGGGQAALATAYFLRRTSLSFVLLDAESAPGGAWQHAWRSLRLFSPATWSSIAGRQMPPKPGGYPTRDDVIAYLADYEQHYKMPVERPVWVDAVRQDGERLVVSSGARRWRGRAVVSATGTWRNPFRPPLAGADTYMGEQLHSAEYVEPTTFAGKRVLVIGGGNSGAQILAEVSTVASATWITLDEPNFLPDDVDGRVLFAGATERWKAQQEGRTIGVPVGGLGDIVMVPPVKEARERGVLHSVRPFDRLSETGVVWADGTKEQVDAVIWCTGFRPALAQLETLGVIEPDGRVLVHGTRSTKLPNLWLLGYGDWTGAASATLIGVTRTARSTVAETQGALSSAPASSKQLSPGYGSALEWTLFYGGARPAYCVPWMPAWQIILRPGENRTVPHAITNTEVFLIAMAIIFSVPYLVWRLGRTDYVAPLVVVQIIAGIVLGPGVLGKAFPDYYTFVFTPDVVKGLNGLAWWAVMLFVMIAGVELDIRKAWANRRESGVTAGLALSLPMLFGSVVAAGMLGLPGWMGAKGLPWQFVVGVGMSCAVTALPILILLMEKLEILRAPIGQRLLRYASIDDVAIWGVLALILMDWERIGRQVAFLALFGISCALYRRLMPKLPARDRWYVALIWLALCSFGADWSGLHFMVGAFLAGVVMDAEWFDQEQMDALRGHVLLVMMPVFFLSTGLKTSWSVGGSAVFVVAAALLFASVTGKLAGVHLAGRLLGWKPGEASMIGWLLQTKALIMIIFVNILLDKEIITSGMFTALLLMAIASTMLTVPVVAPKLRRLARSTPAEYGESPEIPASAAN